jgi:DnaJ-class molecular chaperone
MKILRPRQRCETCNGSGRTDYFGLLSEVECTSCHGTGYSRTPPPVEYVHPDMMYKETVKDGD